MSAHLGPDELRALTYEARERRRAEQRERRRAERAQRRAERPAVVVALDTAVEVAGRLVLLAGLSWLGVATWKAVVGLARSIS